MRAVAAFALLLGGCATAALPPVAAPALAPAYADPAAGTDRTRWLRDLADPGLDALIARGLVANPTVEAAIARVATARGLAASARAEQQPDITGSASVTRQQQSRFQFGAGDFAAQIPRNRTLVQPGVTAQLDLDLFGRLRSQRRAAALRLDAADADAAGARLTLVSDIARQWAAARFAQARIAVAEANIADSRDLLGVTAVRVKAGLVSGLDEARATSLLAQAQAALPPLQADRRAALAALGALTDQTPTVIEAQVGKAAQPPVVLALPAAGVPSDLLRRRPDIAVADRRLAAAGQDVAAAVRSRYPSLTLTGTLGLLAGGFGGLVTGDALYGSAAAGLAGPLLDFGRIQAVIAERTGRRAEAVAAYRSAVLEAVAQVDTALAEADAQSRRARELATQVEADADAVNLNRILYRRGLTDFLGALDAQRTLSASRDARLVADAASLDAALRLWRAAGGDLPDRAPAAINTDAAR